MKRNTTQPSGIAGLPMVVVLLDRYNTQVASTVVASVEIDVIDELARLQQAADHPLNHESVAESVLAIESASRIAKVVGSPFPITKV
jgi:hypothetical protein